VPALEVVTRDQTSRLELRKHAIDCRKADFLARIQKILVNILGTQVAVRGILQDLENLDCSINGIPGSTVEERLSRRLARRYDARLL
jgi:hypothetical protein